MLCFCEESFPLLVFPACANCTLCHHRTVNAVLLHQTVMIARFSDLPVADDHDLICTGNGIEPVRNDQQRLALANKPSGKEQRDSSASFQSAKNIQTIAISAIDRLAMPSGMACASSSST